MKEKLKGKAIYNPSGKAGEYSRWACNFFTGCSNDCNYCYCKKGYLGRIWTDRPQLKKCFRDTDDAYNVFRSELKSNIDELRTHGLFFTFTSDPMLEVARPLTMQCMRFALDNGVPVQILTKRAEFADDILWKQIGPSERGMVAFGFTLTGCDGQEPGASSNAERMEAMRKLYGLGYPTFASIEPVIEPERSMECITSTSDCCNLYKVGLMSGKRDYDKGQLLHMIREMEEIHYTCGNLFYLKDSLTSFLKLDRNGLGAGFVNMDYDIFNSQNT